MWREAVATPINGIPGWSSAGMSMSYPRSKVGRIEHPYGQERPLRNATQRVYRRQPVKTVVSQAFGKFVRPLFGSLVSTLGCLG